MSYDLKDPVALSTGVTDGSQFFGALSEEAPQPSPFLASALWEYVAGKIVGTYPVFFPTTGIPDNDVGVDGSVAIDYAAGLSYVKEAGAWGGATAMRLRPRGAYGGATAYLVGDVVTDQSASWVNLAASTGVAPPTLPTETSATWALLAKSSEVEAEAAIAAAEAARDAAEAARDAAFANASVYADIATGRSAVADGAQFMVVSGDEIIRYRRDSSSTQTEMARYPTASSLASVRAIQMFADPFFDVYPGNGAAQLRSRNIYNTSYNNRSWVADYRHSLGIGAWLVSASSVTLSGFETYWYDVPVVAGDTLQAAMVVKAAAGTRIGIALLFPGGSQTGTTTMYATGGEDVITTASVTVPAGVNRVTCYIYDMTPAGDIYVLSHWTVLNGAVGTRPPLRNAPAVAEMRQRALGRGVSDMAIGALRLRSTVAYGSTSVAHAATQTGTTSRDDAFSGWGDTYQRPASTAFNAVRIASLARAAGTRAWRKLQVVVRTHATAPQTAGALVLAVGEIYVDPDVTSLGGLLIPLRHPVTRAVRTITEADLLDYFSVLYWTTDEAGSGSACGEAVGTVAGLTRVQSYYVTPYLDPINGNYSAVSGNTSIPLQLEMLTSPAQATDVLPTAALTAALGVTSPVVLSAPTPSAPTISPRIFGMIGLECNIYLKDLHSGAVPRAYDVTCAVGAQQDDRWTLTPATVSDGVAWSVDVIDADHLTVLGSASATLDVASNSAAAGASKRLLCIGDSTTAAGTYTSRLLTVAAAYPSAVQPTLMGTQGSGSNKHEGRSGKSVAWFYSDPTSPFYNSTTGLFDCAKYLADNAMSAPDVVLWHLGINDVFSSISDAAANAVMDGAIDRLRRMIGVEADANVGSVAESNAACVHLIAMPIAPAAHQDPFGLDYANGQHRARYKRNIMVAAYRLRQAFASLEASKIYLLPWHVTVDPQRSFPTATEVAHAHTAETVARQSNSVHPATAGYNQMGDALFAAINWMVVKGHV